METLNTKKELMIQILKELYPNAQTLVINIKDDKYKIDIYEQSKFE